MLDFSTPIWLLGLLPWGGLTLWLLLGMRRGVWVPFLDLWKTAEPATRNRRRVQIPPVALIFLILATLAAIFAAAGPGIKTASISNQRIVVIVDRGITMSDPSLFDKAMDEAQKALDGRVDPSRVRCINIPTHAEGDWSAARQWPATGISTRSMVQNAVDRALREDQLVLLISNQDISIDNPRLVRFVPAGTLKDVAITHIGAAAIPNSGGGQVMLELSNHSDLQSIDVEIHTADTVSVHPVALPPSGGRRNVFIDLPKLGPTVQATLRETDSIPLDDSACLVLRGASVRINPLFQLPAELGRMMEIYQHQQPAGGHNQTLLIAPDAVALPDAMPAVVLPQSSQPATGAIEVINHPITAQVQWDRWDWRLTDQPPPAGWSPLVTIGQKTALAITDHPVRRVWVGVGGDEFSRSAQFVMFWTDVLDYLADGTPRYESQTVHPLGKGWKRIDSADTGGIAGLWPGFWKIEDRQVALNAELFDWPRITPEMDSMARLDRGLHSQTAGWRDIAGAMTMAALGLLAIAALVWPAGRLTWF
ncbi:MAG: hypothetical protein IT446_09100 [Phycisphaerales bacterium]|nr:hypothetical protein [Phycisphaerales bacterium]